jgi:hypothetical protein
VGLQTPGEVVDANFGQEPFVFDIEDMMRELGDEDENGNKRFSSARKSRWMASHIEQVSSFFGGLKSVF